MLSGKISDEKLFESEIRTGGTDLQHYIRLGRSFSYPTAKHLAELAIKFESVIALQALAHLQPLATTEALTTLDGVHIIARAARKGDIGAPQLFFQLRRFIRGQYRQTFQKLARSTIIHSALQISGRGLRPEIIRNTSFYPGLNEFDLDTTFEQTLHKPNSITYDDIIGIERIAKKKIGIIILDTSGSMVGPKLLTAAIAAAVAAYHLRNDKYALIAFNTAATTVKAMNQHFTVDHIVDTILETEPAGYTNIADGLKTAYVQYKHTRRREAWTILITDGIANRGGDPEPYARNFHRLHVLQTPGSHLQGDQFCQRIAKLGKGRHVKVNDYTDVPHALMRILRHT